MEKQEINVSYKGSGVKTLKGFGVFFFVIGSIALLVVVIAMYNYLDSHSSSDEVAALSLAGVFSPIGCISLFAGAVCTGLSSIAKVLLYKRMVLEQQYDFNEPEKKTPWYNE
jgi:K+-sensing histidine kinase KdpD